MNIHKIISFLISITVHNGAQIAKKTLNPSLGIIGGISILGNSGIVEPHSNKAYLDTIKICIKSFFLEKQKKIILCTGARTEKFAKSANPHLPNKAFIRIGDFIAETLKEIGKYKFKEVNIICMPGKLFKYSCGYENTHAHNVKLDIQKLEPLFKKLEIEDFKTILKCSTINEVLSKLTTSQKDEVLRILTKTAIKNFKIWIARNQNIKLKIICL